MGGLCSNNLTLHVTCGINGMQEIDFAAGRVWSSFLKSLMWIPVIIACDNFAWMTANVLFVDFFQINPHRSQLHAISLPFIFTPIIFIVAFIGTALVLSLSQFVQAHLANAL